eukprot:708339-Alexandrium_andersonii.AAC.1
MARTAGSAQGLAACSWPRPWARHWPSSWAGRPGAVPGMRSVRVVHLALRRGRSYLASLDLAGRALLWPSARTQHCDCNARVAA